MTSRFLTTFLLMTLSLAGGYACRKLRLLGARAAGVLMTSVAVFGYPLVSLLAIWNTPLHARDIWLPVLSVVQMFLLAGAGLVLAGRLTDDRGERGLLTVTSAFGNHGLTMGGFVVFLILGEHGLGLANVYFMLFAPMVVLLAYPLARHFATEQPEASLGRLLVRSLLDWRSIGLPMAAVGILLSPSVLNVPRPPVIDRWRVVEVMMYAINVAAYFGIGLQLSMSYVPVLKKLIAGLAFTRYVVGAATGLGLVALTQCTPWPVAGEARDVVLIESFVSTAVTNVAVAGMFGLRPREASVLFVTNTLLYLAAVLPLVLWLYR
jgi:hypothetical protein